MEFYQHIQREFEKAIYAAMGIPPGLLEKPEKATFSAMMDVQESYSKTILEEMERIQRQLDELMSRKPKFVVPEQMARLFKKMLESNGLTYHRKERGIFKIFNQHGFCAWMYIVHDRHDKVLIIDRWGNEK